MPALPEDEALELLRHGELEVEGRLMDASNATLRCVITLGDTVARCVYKPVSGERPLWDFPDGTLAGREYSAWLLSQATGWGIVPPTLLRDGPLGPGMVQLWIDDELQSDDLLLGFVPANKVPRTWRRIMQARDERGRPFVLAHADDPRLARIAVFDAIANNADRKGGHVIDTVDGAVHGVDHGICFHTEDKLRTIIWGWAGEPLPDEGVEVLEKLRAQYAAGLAESLSEHLTPAEVGMVSVRIGALLRTRRFPSPDEDRHAIPWPPI
ncbi:SCO1664 family protein [Dactylosporangium sp. NPDC051541]|uniref:SCO1664 family protein n=1 Tax=Dactylosporangium sp. NPDC051541 TaxID=3363977 RepID=UPI0037A9E3FB